MTVIAVSNPKGGSGKTTVALNLGVFLQQAGRKVQFLDLDEQTSLYDAVKRRPKSIAPLFCEKGNIERLTEKLADQGSASSQTVQILDCPARLSDAQSIRLLASCHIMLMPALLAPIDASALVHYIFRLVRNSPEMLTSKPIALIANRVKRQTRAYPVIKRDMDRMHFPLIGELRDTQNYAFTGGEGMGVSELPQTKSVKDLNSWQPILQWIYHQMEQSHQKSWGFRS